MNLWQCDMCGKKTFLNPKTEQVFEKVGEGMGLAMDPETNKPIIAKTDDQGNVFYKQEMKPIMKPTTIKTRRQDLARGVVDTVDMPVFKTLEPASIIVHLRVGNEKVQVDFCENCFNENIKPMIKPVYEKLMDFAEQAAAEGR